MPEWTNLLRETSDAIAECGMTPTDVQWVGSRDGEYGISWDAFAAIADFDYDAGFGKEFIPRDLVVVFGRARWLERYTYDGAEKWKYKEAPILRNPSRVFSKISSGHDRYVHSLRAIVTGEDDDDDDE